LIWSNNRARRRGADTVSEPHRDAVLAKGPDLLDQAVIQLPVPLARQEYLYGSATLENSDLFRQILSVVYASATRAGSRVFHASSAIRAFCAAGYAAKPPQRQEDSRPQKMRASRSAFYQERSYLFLARLPANRPANSKQTRTWRQRWRCTNPRPDLRGL